MDAGLTAVQHELGSVEQSEQPHLHLTHGEETGDKRVTETECCCGELVGDRRVQFTGHR